MKFYLTKYDMVFLALSLGYILTIENNRDIAFYFLMGVVLMVVYHFVQLYCHYRGF